jgi:MT0933-like antitoxin protein
MGLRDKIAGLREQAQEAVAQHRDQIQDAMETAGAAVDRKTHGKYTDKIAKYGEKATNAVESFSGGASDEGAPGTHADPPSPGTP